MQKEQLLVLQGIANILATLSFAMAAFNLLPFVGSDGHRIWRELRT